MRGADRRLDVGLESGDLFGVRGPRWALRLADRAARHSPLDSGDD
ncbi:hypothetical protein [Streptomyces umbrinus]